MRAAVCERPGELQVQERPDPELGPDEIVVHVGACGVYGMEIHIAEGETHTFALDDFEDALGTMRAGDGLKVQVLPNS